MKILVPVKRVIDANVHVKLERDGSDVVTDGVKMALNPFDAIALEQALRLRDDGTDVEILVVSIGPDAARQQLRTALAMGADRALLVTTADAPQPLLIAKALHAIIRDENPALVLMGKQAIDDDASQTGPMLAALWDRPQATFTSGLALDGDAARCTREVDAGLETIDVDLPAVITTDLRLNQPRYVKMRNIMKAKQKPLDARPLDTLVPDAPARLTVTQLETPPARGGHCVMVDDAAGLVAALKEKGVLS